MERRIICRQQEIETQPLETGPPPRQTLLATQDPFSLFVGGFNLNLSKEDVSHIISDDIGLEVTDLTQIKRNDYNQSFKVDINLSDKIKALDPNRWYQGLIVKPFRTSSIRKFAQKRQNQPQDFNTLHDTNDFRENNNPRPNFSDSRHDNLNYRPDFTHRNRY